MHNKRYIFFSPDDAGGSGDSGGEGNDDSAGSGSSTSQGDTSGSQGERETSEVARLRAENAQRRIENKDLKDRLQKLEDAGKSETEKERDARVKAEADAQAASTRARDALARALASEVGIVKEARSDAVKLIDWDSVTDPNDERQIEKALKDLVKAKPFLLGRGGADGGTGGQRQQKTSMNDAIREKAGVQVSS